MTTPAQTIEDTLLTRLRNITTANDYDFDIGTVSKEDRDRNEWNPCVLDIIVVKMPDVYNETYSCPGNPYKTAFDVEWEINCFHKQLDLESDEPGIVCKNVTEDAMRTAVQKAIVNDDASQWHTFGTTACKNARFLAFEPVDDPGFDVLKVRLLTIYRVHETDSAVAG